jgi:hypothetical protein
MAVGPHAEHDAHHRSGQKRGADQQPELGVGQAVLPLDFDPDDCENRPNRKAANITQRRDNQDPLAETLKGADWVLGLLAGRDVSGATYGHARLISK